MAEHEISGALSFGKLGSVIVTVLVLAGVGFYVYQTKPEWRDRVLSLAGGVDIPEEMIRKEVGDTLPVYIKGELVKHAIKQTPETNRAMLAALNAGLVLQSVSAEPVSHYRNNSEFWMTKEDRDITLHAVFSYGQWTAKADFRGSISRSGQWTVHNTTQLTVVP